MYRPIKLFLLAILCGMLCLDAYTVTRAILPQLTTTLTHLFATEDEKNTFILGPRIAYMISEIKKNTPPDATIMLPPQANPWGTEGNPALMASLLYPRRVTKSKTVNISKDELAHVDYILFSSGEGMAQYPESVPSDLRMKRVYSLMVGYGEKSILPTQTTLGELKGDLLVHIQP